MKRDISPIENDNRYLTEAGVGMERQADYKTGEKMQAAFHVMSHKEVDEYYKKNPGGNCGNLHSHFLVDIKTKKVKIYDDWTFPCPKGFTNLYRAISSSLVLYRLICMFPNPHVIAEGANGYKVPWSMYLKHKETGQVVCMSEWKGTFGFRTNTLSPKETPKKLLTDLSTLLNLMLSNNSPHPYDSTVAGSVA